MASPVESAETSSQPEECKTLQLYDPPTDTPGTEGVLSSCIISQSPPTEIVNTTTTTSTITDSNGRVKKLKTTTTTTLRTTTTVRRVCVVAPGNITTTTGVPEGSIVLPEGSTVLAETPDLPIVAGEKVQQPAAGSGIVRLTHVSGNEGNPTQPRNITQVTFMKPQTQTSEVVEVHTGGKSGDEELVEGASQAKTTTKTVRKRVTTSVSAVFASRHTKVDSKNAPHHLKNCGRVPFQGDSIKKLARGNPVDEGSFVQGSSDLSNDDSAAMTALRECERQFATRLGITKTPPTDGSTTVVDHYTSENGKTTKTTTTTLRGTGFPSLFDGLPLYQGYGMIGQHTKANDPSESPVSIFFNGSLDKIDVASLTKMFEEATKTTFLSNDLNNFFGDLTMSQRPAIEIPGVVIEEASEKDQKESEVLEGRTSGETSRKASVPSISEGAVALDAAATAVGETETETVGYKHQILNQLATKTGPCRIAWSEMPEVLSGNLVASLTRHEIQLQEAMFEVITSEASYYRSLQVLIEHFYSAPEFDCSRSAPTSMEVPSSGAENDNDNTPAQGSEGRASCPSSGLGGYSRAGSISTSTEATAVPVVKSVLSPTEKHHLFSNVLLICMASERFLKDLEARWSSQKPLLSEVSDLIVKHAGSVQFEPYLTYLRNQTYQVAAYRRLNRREDFQKAIARMHAHPEVGKNRLDSFLALPMQRLTRLKLLVEVIQKLQMAVISDSEEDAVTGSTETMTPGGCEGSRRMKITPQQLENSSIALRELKRLLSESESEKQLMDEKARLLALSSALEFPENVKRIAISDKRLVKEGELKSASSDGKAAVLLKKLGRKKPETFYLILFHDLLMVTKLKKNDRYLVQDYCPRDKVYVTIGNPSEAALNPIMGSFPRSQALTINNGGGFSGITKRQKRPSANILGFKGGPRHYTTTPEVPEALFSTGTEAPAHPSPPAGYSLSSASSDSSNIEVCGAGSPASPPLSPSRLSSVRLRRSGSSLSSKSVPTGASYTPPSSTINRDLPLLLYVCLTESQSGCCTEFCFTTNNSSEYEAWYRALHSKSLKANNRNPVTEEEGKTSG
ncbi:guanine nucleotide exchange factor [Echinococcus multilocularis]|uniref:Guanine nucleotide exchange factor n=1 Tax=Echinococcus multilocularis TaxID=6211 RepID=A0A087VXV0_ECHMU|nr:guanine nucleotide exchange factor [Echinococcus multilocularis]